MPRRIIRNITWLSAVFHVLGAAAMHAQNAAPVLPTIPESQLPSTKQIRQSVERFLATQRDENARSVRDKKAQAPKLPPPIPGLTDANCAQIKKLSLPGVTLLTASERSNLRNQIEGKCVGLKSIDAMMRAITAVYFEKGYVTARVYIPPQTIADGELTLQIEEGIVEGLAYNGDPEKRKLALQSLFSGLVGKPANLRDVEQGIEFINRLPSSRAKIAYVAGSKPGHTILNLTDSPQRRLRFSVSMNNEGSDQTGEYSTTYKATLDNPLGLYDQLSFSYGFTSDRLLRFDTDPESSETYSLKYSIPFGASLLSFSVSHYAYEILVTPTIGFPIPYSGETETFRIDHETTLMRDQTQVVKFILGYQKSETDNYITSFGVKTKLDDQSRIQASFSYGISYSKRLSNGNVNATLTHERAVFPEKASHPNHVSFGDLEANYEKYLLNMGYSRVFALWDKSAVYSGSFVAQHSPDNLLGTQSLSIGGRYSVRGIRKAIGSGNRGYYLQNDLSLSLNQFDFAKSSKFLSGLTPYIGLDYGRIAPNFNNEESSATGMAIGLKGAWKHLNFNLSAERLVKVHDRGEAARALGIRNADLYDTRWYFTLEAVF